jgi:enamine deaminase RidA (YjgF/YER057c/UK114 family)
VRQRIASGSPLEPWIGFSRAVRTGDQVFVSATAAIRPDGHVSEDVAEQARRCLAIIAEALEEAESSLADVVRTRVYLVDAAVFDGFARAHGEAFSDVRPANTTVVVKELLDPRWVVEIEAEAVKS